jgi:hypothetical protein
MIPYDDLVTALATWRARQGLPTGQLVDAPAAKPAPAPAPAKAAPAPAASRDRKSRPVSVVPEDSLDIDEGALLEASIDSELASAFGSEEVGESTAIGTAPAPARHGAPPRRGGR